MRTARRARNALGEKATWVVPGRSLSERVRRRSILGVQAVSRQQAPHSGGDGAQDIGHVGRRGRRRAVKPEGAGRGPRKHAIEHQGVHVDVEVHRPTKALDDGDTTAPWTGETLVACPGTKVPLDRMVQNARNATAHVVVPGQQIPDPVRHTQDPLADRHVGKDAVDEVRCAFGHAPPTAARAKTPLLARERDEPFGLALTTAESRKAAGKESTSEERPELVLNESGQPVAVPQHAVLVLQHAVHQDERLPHGHRALLNLIFERQK